jgi:hypothetical protein
MDLTVTASISWVKQSIICRTHTVHMSKEYTSAEWQHCVLAIYILSDYCCIHALLRLVTAPDNEYKKKAIISCRMQSCRNSGPTCYVMYHYHRGRKKQQSVAQHVRTYVSASATASRSIALHRFCTALAFQALTYEQNSELGPEPLDLVPVSYRHKTFTIPRTSVLFQHSNANHHFLFFKKKNLYLLFWP